ALPQMVTDAFERSDRFLKLSGSFSHYAFETSCVIVKLPLGMLQFCLRLHHFGHISADSLEQHMIVLLRSHHAYLYVNRNPLSLRMAKAADVPNGRPFRTQRRN